MVRFAFYILGSYLAVLGAASPVIWQHQYDVSERSPASQEAARTTIPSSSSPSTMTRTTHSQNCTVDSFTNVTSFILKEYQLETVLGPGNSTQFRGTFAVENPGSGDTYRLYHIPVSIGGGVWSVCRAGEDAPLPAELVICQYLLERRNRRIGFRFEWDCDGKDSDHPVLFDATVIGDLPTETCVAPNGTNGVTQSCGLAVDAGVVLLPIQNISWMPASEAED